MTATHIFLGNLSPAPGAGDEFERLWEVHAQEVVDNIEGFVAARRYHLESRQRPWSPPAAWSRLTIYDLEGDDVDAIHRDNTRVRESGVYTPFGHLVAPGNIAHVFTPVGTPYRTDGWGGRAEASRLVLVRSNPAEGREDDYNAWYEIHVREVVDSIAGFRGGSRFRLSESQRPGMAPSPWRYVTVMELDDTPLEEVYASNEEVKRNRESIFTMGDDTYADMVGHVFAAVGPRLEQRAGDAAIEAAR